MNVLNTDIVSYMFQQVLTWLSMLFILFENGLPFLTHILVCWKCLNIGLLANVNFALLTASNVNDILT